MGEFLTKEAAFERLDFAKSKGIPPDQALKDLANAGFEVEGYNAEFDFGEMLSNVPRSGWEFTKALWSMVSSPFQTIGALDSIAKGGMKQLFNKMGFEVGTTGPGAVSVKDEEAWNNTREFFINRYGGVDAALNTLEKDPIGFISDASIAISGGAGALSKVPGLSKVALPAKVTQATGKLAEATQTAKIPVVGKPARAITRELAEIKTVKDIPVKISRGARALEPTTVAINTTRKGMQLLHMDEFAGRMLKTTLDASDTFIKNLAGKNRTENPTKFLTDHAIPSSLPEGERALQKVADVTYKKVDELLAPIPGKHRNPDTISLLNEEIKTLAKETEDVVSVIDEVPQPLKPKERLTANALAKKMERGIGPEAVSRQGLPKGERPAEIDNMLNKYGDENFVKIEIDPNDVKIKKMEIFQEEVDDILAKGVEKTPPPVVEINAKGDLVKIDGTHRIRAAQISGKPIEVYIPEKQLSKLPTKTKQIPGTFKENLIVPKPNLSQESLAVFKRMKELRQKYLSEGLTVTEMQEIKRLSYDTLDIYGRTVGEARSAAKAKQLDRLYKNTEKFIEDKALAFGKETGSKLHGQIKGLNRQTQLAQAWKDLYNERILLGRQRMPLFERLTVITAAGGAAGAYGGKDAALLSAIGMVGAIEIYRVPRVRNFIASRISLMTNGEFKKFLGQTEHFVKTGEKGPLFRQVRREALRYARLGGVAQQQTEQRIPIQKSTVQ